MSRHIHSACQRGIDQYFEKLRPSESSRPEKKTIERRWRRQDEQKEQGSPVASRRGKTAPGAGKKMNLCDRSKMLVTMELKGIVPTYLARALSPRASAREKKLGDRRRSAEERNESRCVTPLSR